MPEVEPGASPGRDRLLRALRRPVSRGQLVAAVLVAVVGFAAAVQVRAGGRDDGITGARQAELVALLDTLTLAGDRAEAEIADLQRTRDALRDDNEATRTATRLAQDRVRTLGILAGTLPAVGPGIQITVTGRPGDVGTDQLLNGLQELRDAGAEAIEINDQVRVVAQTAVADRVGGGGAGLTVGGTPLAPPYVLDVIGDGDTLAAAVDFTGGFIDEVEQVGGRVAVEKLDRVEVATVIEPTRPRFARGLDEPGE